MNKTIKLSEASDVITEVLDAGGEVTFITAGISMMPLLRDRQDKVILSKPKSAPIKNDVIFYQRNDGTYVLHRIIDVYNGEYTLRGDNQWQKEHGITEKNIIAIAVGFYRNNKHIRCTDFNYRFYCFSLPVIRFFKRVYGKLLSFFKK